MRREGLVAEVFLEPSFYRDTFSLGVGLGGYVASDDYRGGGTHAMPLVTTTIGWHFARGCANYASAPFKRST